MAELSDERSQHLADTAHRLRRVQIDFADRDEEVRRLYIVEELGRALNTIAPREQHEFLEHLWQRFPQSPDRDVQESSAQESSAGAEDPNALWSDGCGRQVVAPEAAALATRLVQVFARPGVAELIADAAPTAPASTPVSNPQPDSHPGISPADELTGHAAADPSAEPNGYGIEEPLDHVPAPLDLPQSDPIAPAAPAIDEQVVRAFCQKLDLQESETPNPERVVELAGILIDFLLPMYQMTWATWRVLSPQSSIRRSANLQRSLAGFVCGGEVSREQIAAELNRLRQMTASLVTALGHIGPRVSSEYLSRFLPSEIEQVVASEPGGGLFRSQAARCWQKFLELSTMLDPATVETEIRRSISEHVEQLMKGAGAAVKTSDESVAGKSRDRSSRRTW